MNLINSVVGIVLLLIMLGFEKRVYVIERDCLKMKEGLKLFLKNFDLM